MIRKLKFLGSALLAVLAIGAVGASAASATVEFRSEKAPVTLTGTQEGESSGFDVQFGEVKCKTVKYTGTSSVASTTTYTLVPLHESCTFGGVAATIDMNGCHYIIHVYNLFPFLATTSILCEAGKSIVITGGTKCTIDIPAQNNLGSFSLSNVGSGTTREITASLGSIQNITYTQTAGTGAIKCTNLTSNTGKFTGTAILTGETDPGSTHIGVWVE